MKLSKLYKINRKKRRKQNKSARKELEDQAKTNQEQFDHHILKQSDIMPDRGPSEYGNMSQYANLDRAH